MRPLSTSQKGRNIPVTQVTGVTTASLSFTSLAWLHFPTFWIKLLAYPVIELPPPPGSTQSRTNPPPHLSPTPPNPRPKLNVSYSQQQLSLIWGPSFSTLCIPFVHHEDNISAWHQSDRGWEYGFSWHLAASPPTTVIRTNTSDEVKCILPQSIHDYQL